MVLVGDSINYIESIYGISSADIATRYILNLFPLPSYYQAVGISVTPSLIHSQHFRFVEVQNLIKCAGIACRR
jgi:hypothetical protein